MITNINLQIANKQNGLTKPDFTASKKTNPNFGGFTRLVMDTPLHPRPFHSTEDFLKIAGEFKSKTIGKLPKEFLTLFPNDPKKVFQFLDELSIFTRGLSFNNCHGLPEIKDEIKLSLSSGKILNTEYLGEGHFGKAFKIDFPEKSFAFKTFRGIYEHPAHGELAEIKSGINFSGEDYEDLAKTHIGNFENNKEWTILEYISPKDFAKHRKGKKISSNRHELTNFDNNNPDNYINGILIDLGGITSKKNQSSTEKNTNMTINDKLILTDSKEKRMELFYKTLNSNNPRDKKGLGYAIEILDWDKSKQYFYDVLNDPHPESKLGLETNFDILKLEDRKEAYNDWMKYLKSQVTLFETDI